MICPKCGSTLTETAPGVFRCYGEFCDYWYCFG